MSLDYIEQLARDYSVHRGTLIELVNELENEKARLMRKYLTPIRNAVAAARNAQSRLMSAVEQNPHLFVRPRTLVLHGIKVGWQKGKGGIQWDDEEGVVSRIEKLYAGDQAMLDQLLIVRKKPRKEGLESLDVATLKKLGCTVVESGDQVIVRATDSEVDKLVAALLADADE